MALKRGKNEERVHPNDTIPPEGTRNKIKRRKEKRYIGKKKLTLQKEKRTQKMRRKIFSTLLLLVSLCGANLYAENDIINDLNEDVAGQGNVNIHQSQSIQNLLVKEKNKGKNKNIKTYAGYRVQAYMGNSQRTAKAEATSREKKIALRFPEWETYLTFNSPFWRLRVGNFRTHADAMVLARQIKAAFPHIEGDIYVVKDNETVDPDAKGE